MKITQLPNGGEMCVDGDRQVWYLNGKMHRTDGPAIINGDYQAWWLNGQRHRVDGPAIINGDRQVWYLNGERMTEQQHAEKVAAMTVDEVKAPKFKVGDTVKFVGGAGTYQVIEVRGEFVRLQGSSTAWYHQGDLELAHVHHFTCECGESRE